MTIVYTSKSNLDEQEMVIDQAKVTTTQNVAENEIAKTIGKNVLVSTWDDTEYSQILVNNQKVANDEHRAYLAKTDWYATRAYETGVAIPEEVAKKRKEARDSIV